MIVRFFYDGQVLVVLVVCVGLAQGRGRRSISSDCLNQLVEACLVLLHLIEFHLFATERPLQVLQLTRVVVLQNLARIAAILVLAASRPILQLQSALARQTEALLQITNQLLDHEFDILESAGAALACLVF